MGKDRDMRVVIVGAGRVGLSLAGMLDDADGFDVMIADCTDEALSAARASGLEAVYADAARPEEIRRLLVGADLVAAAVPDRLVPALAAAAVDAGVNYLDFSEATEETLAAGTRQQTGRAFLSGCGVSPGLVDAIAFSLAMKLDPGCDVDVRVGAIPARRTNRLGYGMIWNLDGLIAEYTEPCAAILGGKAAEIPPLSGLVEFLMDGVDYEAFHTSGSLNALKSLLESQVRNLTFRTIRYPGHLDYMQFLLDDLDLKSRHYLLTTVLRNGLPVDEPDALVIQVNASGARNGKPADEQFSCRIEASADHAVHGALALASAAHAATLIDILRAGRLSGENLKTPSRIAHDAIFRSPFFERLTHRVLEAA